jgi:transcriptional regulator with XRE-family HTH domain
MSALSDWLADELTRRGWSHNELARRAGVSQPNVSAIVKGQNPGCDFCIKIAAALGESPEKVLRLAGILPPASEDDPTLAELHDLVSNLPLAKRKEALQYLRFLYRREDEA